MASLDNMGRAIMAGVVASLTFATTSGTDTYTASISPAPGAYKSNFLYCIDFATTNTSTTPTLNLNSLGAKTITDAQGNALVAGSLNGPHGLMYDGTNLRVLNPAKIANANLAAGVGTSANNLVALDGSAKLPAVDGSQLTNVSPGGGAVERLTIANNASTPATKIDVSHGPITLVDSSGRAFWFGSGSGTLDLTTGTSSPALDGMDGESRPTSGWGYVWAISDGTSLKRICSTSNTAPTLTGLTGYTFKKYLGAVLFDGSTNLMRTKQAGRRSQYTVVASTNTPHLPPLGSGTLGTFATSPSTPTWDALSVSGAVPPTAGSIVLDVSGGALIIVAPNANYAGFEDLTNPPPIQLDVSWLGTLQEMLLEATTIQAASNGSNCLIQAMGWNDIYV
jgi:hypothetical protein